MRNFRSADVFGRDGCGTRRRGRLFPTSLVLAISIVGLILTGCAKEEKEEGGSAEKEKKAGTESRVKHGTNDEVIITLDAKTQQVMGLQTAPLQSAKLSPEIKGYGHVIDSSPLTSLVADLLSARAAAAASGAELKRLQTLSSQNNASERALQAAQATAARDNSQVESTRLRLLGNWGNGIASRNDLPEFVQQLSSLTAVLVQLNLAAGEAVSNAPVGAHLLTLAEPTKPIEAQVVGPAPVTDPQLQSKGFFLLVSPNTNGLAVGEAVNGTLALPGEPQTGLAVPRDAIVQFNGVNWVYLQTSDDTFKRVELPNAPALDNAVFVRQGLSPGDKVVTVGAQQLLSEELKGQLEE